MAAIKEKDRKDWRAYIRYVDWQGVSQIHTKRGFRTKKEALEYEREFLLMKSKDINMGFEQFVKVYLADVKPQIKYSTYLTKEHNIKTHILPYFANKTLAGITATDIIQWQNELLSARDKNDKPYAQTYLRTVQNQLNAIMNHAHRYYGLSDNPVNKGKKMGKAKAKEMLFWTKEEYLKFAEVMKSKPVSYYAFEILYWTGIRRDAQFCAYSAGSVEHFEFLMKKIGYEFQPGKYLRVRIPGRKTYHRLDKMHEMFEEGKLQYWVDKPWSAKPYFYSNNPEKIYHAGMSDYQKRFYAKMYRMRVIEHKRFDYKLAGKVLKENTYTALSVGLENEAVMDAEKVVVPECVSMRDVVTNLNNTIGEDVISETAVSKEEKLDDVSCEDAMLVESDSEEEEIEEMVNTDMNEDECATEPSYDSLGNNEEIIASDFPKRYTEYMALALEARVNLHGFLDGKLGVDVFGVVRRNFEKAGYSVAFDDISDEAIAIEKYISEQKCISNAEMIAEKLKEYSSYEKIPWGVKAEVFGFEIDDSNGNLKLYMQVMKALGMRMDQEEMFEDYQKVYEETIKRQGDYNMEKKIWERGKVR